MKKYYATILQLGLLLSCSKAWSVATPYSHLGITSDLFVPFFRQKDKLAHFTLHMNFPSAFNIPKNKLHASQSLDRSGDSTVIKTETEGRNVFTALYNGGFGYRHSIAPVGIVGGYLGIDQFQNSTGRHFFLHPSIECFTHGIQISINGYVSQNFILAAFRRINVPEDLPVRFATDCIISGKIRPWLKCFAGGYRITYYRNYGRMAKEVEATPGFAGGFEFIMNTYSSFEIKGTYNNSQHNPFYLSMTVKLFNNPHGNTQGLRGTNWVKPVHQHLYSILVFNSLDEESRYNRPTFTRTNTGGFRTPGSPLSGPQQSGYFENLDAMLDKDVMFENDTGSASDATESIKKEKPVPMRKIPPVPIEE